jgi:hypothetical protein
MSRRVEAVDGDVEAIILALAMAASRSLIAREQACTGTRVARVALSRSTSAALRIRPLPRRARPRYS